jgi:hypothetical protein
MWPEVASAGAKLLGLSLLAGLGLLLPLPSDFSLKWLFNLAHAPVFAAWGYLGCEVLRSRQRARATVWPWVGLAGALLALASETLQLWIPGRWADWRDLLANLAGLALGLALWLARTRPWRDPA